MANKKNKDKGKLPYKNSFVKNVNYDMMNLLENHNFRLTKEIVPLIAIQTIRGHAQKGHSYFNRADPNVTVRDIIYCLDKDMLPKVYSDPEFVAAWRQELILEVFSLVEDMIKGKRRRYCTNRQGEPLLGLETIAGMEINNAEAFFNGIYFASVMDSYEWRCKVRHKYGVEMGGGEEHRSSLTKLRNLGHTIEHIETSEHSEADFKTFKEKGLILKPGRIDDEKALLYFRRRRGMGSIDDLAVIIMHLLYGRDAALGTILGDAVDTFDKYTKKTVEGGYDEQLGIIVGDANLVSMPEDEIVKAMSLIAGANYTGMSHCSVRYFNEIDTKSGITALESHLKFAEGYQGIPPIYIHHPSLNVTNHKLYSQFKNRLGEKFPKLLDRL